MFTVTFISVIVSVILLITRVDVVDELSPNILGTSVAAIVIEEELMVRARFFSAIWCVGVVESVTRTRNVDVDTDAGVPLMVPAEPSVSPTGRVFEIRDQLYGGTPPVAVNDWP